MSPFSIQRQPQPLASGRIQASAHLESEHRFLGLNSEQSQTALKPDLQHFADLPTT
jgi:hypothetical protein